MSFKKICQLADKFEKSLENTPTNSGKEPRQLRQGEGDNVDKMADMVTAIKKHLDAIVPLVNGQQMDQAEDNAQAIEHLAQAMQFLIREMDPGNG